MTQSAAAPSWSGYDLLIVPVLLCAVALRLTTADYSLWFDEIAAVTLARQPLPVLWSDWIVRESNPPLYYTMLKGWMILFGAGDLAVRSLSVLIGTAGIAVSWLIARRLGGISAGLVAALLVTTSTAHIDFSQEVRGYILAQTAALFACLAMVGYINRPRAAPLVGYTVAVLIALYSHTTMLFFVALANLAMVWILRGSPAAVGRWLAANAMVAVLWSWWAWISIKQIESGGAGFSWIPKPDLAEALNMTAIMYLPLYLASENVVLAPLLSLLTLFGLTWFAFKDGRPAVMLLAMMAVTAPMLLWGASQWLPVFLPRTLFWATALVLILVAVAIIRFPSRSTRRFATALLMVVQVGAILRWLPEREVEAWPQSIATIARIDQRAVVMVQGDAMGVAVKHYLATNGPDLQLVIVERPPGGTDRWADGLVSAPRLTADGARGLLVQKRRIFTLARGDFNPSSLISPVGVERPLLATGGRRQPWLSLWKAR